MTTLELLQKTRAAMGSIAAAGAEKKNALLLAMADSLEAHCAEILAANAEDMAAARGRITDVMLDRLKLDENRIAGMANGIRDTVRLPDHTGRVLSEVVRPNGIIIDNKNGWNWEAGLNLYLNRNKLVELASGAERDEANRWFVGHPIDVIYDYKKIGLWQEGDKYLDILEPGGNVGMIKVEYTGDYNADGTPTRQIGPDDRQIMDMEPDLMGGFNTTVGYKGFDLTVIGSFQIGGTLISTLHSSNGYLNMLTGRRGNIDVDY